MFLTFLTTFDFKSLLILSNFNNQLKVRTDKSDSQKENWLSNDNINEISKNLKEKVVKNLKLKMITVCC